MIFSDWDDTYYEKQYKEIIREAVELMEGPGDTGTTFIVAHHEAMIDHNRKMHAFAARIRRDYSYIWSDKETLQNAMESTDS